MKLSVGPLYLGRIDQNADRLFVVNMSSKFVSDLNCPGLPTAGVPIEERDDLQTLRRIEQRVLWLSTQIIHHGNSIRPNPDGVKVGGHQASSASVVSLMT